MATPEAIRELLDAKDFKSVIENDYNVAILPVIEQVQLTDLLNEAVNKYLDKYYSDNK